MSTDRDKDIAGCQFALLPAFQYLDECRRLHGELMCAEILALLELPENSRAVYEALTESGHSVVLSKSFAEAIRVLARGSIDLVISDVHLENGGSVFDFLKWVRLNPGTKAAPFVLLSSNPSVLAKYLEDGIKITLRALGASKVYKHGFL